MIDTLKVGYAIPELLVPKDADLGKWSVIACDQYTQEPEYWDRISKDIGDAPSTLRLILPEILLNTGDVDDIIAGVHETMHTYLDHGVFRELPRGIMLTERTLPQGIRSGVLLGMDLDAYDYDIEKHPMIRASEKTVMERIPPRRRVREGAAVDLPHVMLLIDDPNDTVIGPLREKKEDLEQIYDFDLMEGGGHISGWLATDERSEDAVAEALSKLPRHDGMLYCVGDGNHSLATAKTIWEEAKKDIPKDEWASSPLRYALCEVVNLHEEAVEFLPIHRVLFNTTSGSILDYLVRRLNEDGAKAYVEREKKPKSPKDGYVLPFYSRNESGWLVVEKKSHPLAAGQIQPIFDEYLKTNPGAGIDYIHGEDAVQKLSIQQNTVGFLFPPVEKDGFFDLVVECGVLPRKTFSIGEADGKRFYLEARALASEEE